jgi:branched-chain amino acid transport system ATP-binding protein
MNAGAAQRPALDVRGLCVSYGPVEALHDVSLQIGAGQIVTVIGPNGAGKSTMLMSLIGLLPSSRGRISVHGEPLDHLPVEERVGRGVTLVPERRELFATMTVEDNLLLGAYRLHRAGQRDHGPALQTVYRQFPRLQERRAQIAGTLSGGERAMLVLGRALMSRPSLLLLDEPSLGLAPLVVREIFGIIAELRTTGVSILLIEQNARAALAVSDHGYVLETGRIALEGPSSELANDPRVVASYLGGRAA